MGYSESLSILPPELLARICDFMETKKELMVFALASRQFHAVAVPYLYRHIDLITKPALLRRAPDHTAHHIEALARHFLRHPELAFLVRHLAIRQPDLSGRQISGQPLEPEIQDAVRRIFGPATTPEVQPSDPSAGNIPSSPTLELPAVEDEANGLGADNDSDGDWSEWNTTDSDSDFDYQSGGDFADRWISLAQEDPLSRGDIVLVSLLLCLPRLEKLDLELPSRNGRAAIPAQHLLGQLVARIGLHQSAATPLAKLSSLCLGYASSEARDEIYFSPHLLPGLTSVYLHRISGLWDSWTRSNPWKPHSLNLTHLELRDCRIPPVWLWNILAGPKALKTFIYVIGEVHSRRELLEPISYNSVRIALEQQKDSLEQIWIDYPHDYAFDESSTDDTAPMRSFSTFQKLKHLHIAGTYLFGFVWTQDVDTRRLVRALPQQIETVHLSHADEDVDETTEGISFVLDAKERGRLGKLRELKVDASLLWINDYRNELKELIDRAADLGLNIRLIDNHSDNRIQYFEDWIELAKNNFLDDDRVESPWGFYGEVIWPDRISGCMKQPVYQEVEVKDLLSKADLTTRFEIGFESNTGS